MSERVYFGVIRWNGAEQPRLFFDIVPNDLQRRGSPLVYCTRLDNMPNGEQMITAPLAYLFAVYRRLRDRGKLPAEDRGIKPKKSEAMNNA